jgi:anhydro-N-acetylmuramic acid kinase
MTVVGMISGTSYDAVDAAVADLGISDDTVVLHPRGLHSAPISDAMRERIAACLPPAATTMEAVCRLDTELGQLFGQVAVDAITEFAPNGADLIVSHGQTVFHWVEGGHALGTLQLAAPAWIAEATATTVVSDIRSRDLARGGHGAPLASTLDALLLLDNARRRASLNLGGISNITFRDQAGAVIAYDIGPASALMDAAVTELTEGRQRMDLDGALATAGAVNPEVLSLLLDEEYYREPPPKSTGKELFHGTYLHERLGDHGLCAEDLLATLTELSAQLVGDVCAANQIDELVVAGGGVRNPALMRRITELVSPAQVRPLEDFGLPAQAKEGYLMALLGYLAAHGVEGTIASATGACRPSILGSFTPGEGPLALPAPVQNPIRRLRIRA